jgi:ribose transport system permease protein
MSGVDVNRTKVAAYTISGMAAGAAGFYLTAQTGNGNALAGTAYTLNSIAAVVLGGASLAGGAGTFLGTIAGGYIIALIPRVLFFYDVSQFYQQLLQGIVLLVAVGLGAVGVLRTRNRLDKV